MEGHELLGAASAHQDQERLDEGRGTRIVSRSLSVDTWTRHSSTDGAPPIFENQATGEITQAVPSNSIVYDDSGEKALYTFGNVLDDSVSAGEVWERKIDPVSLRPYYFCSRKGISSWVMPPNAWSERTTLSKARSSFHPPTQDIIQVDANKVERENLVVELAEAHRIEKDKEILNRMMTETAKRWTVHVGEDDSRVFYRNGSGGVQFANPYVFEDETQKNINKEADLESDLHVLLGEGAKPDTVELSNSRAHLSTWITTLHLHVESPWNEASLKYPENVQPIQINGNGYEKLRCRADQHPPLPFQHPFTIFATVKGHMADAHSVFFAEKTIKFSGGDTLGTVMRSIIFPKFRISEKMDKYVLKVAGVKSYLLHDDYPMLWYEYVQEQVRESEGDHVFIKPTFTLVELPPEDEDGVSLLRKRPYHTSTEGTEDEREHFFYSAKMLWERTKDTPELVNDEDRFRATRSQLLIRYGIECFERYPDLVSSPRALEAEKCMPVEEGSTVGRCTCLDWDVFSGSHVDQVIGKLNRGDSISSTFLQWPVRFFIKSLHGLRSNRFVFGKETCVVESIRLDCGIYDRGDIVAECKSSAKLLDSSVYWSSGDSQVQFRHIRVANLTPSSRVGVCLVGIMSDGKEEIIAVGAIRLFDEVGLLWQGRTTLYLSKWSGQMGKVADRVLLMPESRHNGMCKLTLECERFNKPVVYPNCSIRNIMHVAMQQKQGIALTAPHSKTTLRCEGAGALYIVAVSFKALHEIKIIQSSASPGMTMAEKMDIVNSFCKNVEASLRTRFLSIMTAELQITETDLAELEAVACKEKIPPEKIHFYTQLLWEHRYRIVNDGRLLRKFLRIVQWGNFEQAEEARALLGYWAKPTATEALSMLGIGSSDSIVRGYAVWVIGSLDDDDLADYLLQLVQCLKLERHHDSALFRFLLRRGLKSPHRVGHYLYWYLRSELHDEQFHSRFRLLLETYLTHCGPHRKLLVAQAQVVKQLETITKVVMKIPKKESQKRVQTLRHEIELCDWPEEFEICLWPGYNCRGVVSHKCKVMDSKMAPLWIEFENADPAGDNVRVIFKVGDDLRQEREKEISELENKLQLLLSKLTSSGKKISVNEEKKSEVKSKLSELELEISSAEKEYKVRSQTLKMLPNAEENIKKLEGICAASRARLEKFAEEWEKVKTPLMKEYEEIKASVTRRKEEGRWKVGEMRRMREEMRTMAGSIREAEERYKLLSDEFEKMPKNINRAVYTYRIMDIIKQIRKQQGEVDRIVSDIRSVQRALNVVSQKLSRTEAITDEHVFQAASSQKNDPAYIQAYRSLANVREIFDDLVATAEEGGKLESATRDFENRAKQLENRITSQNMERVVADLESVKKENVKLAKAIKKARIG
eukprot:Stramenopile-MAST_4_protein_373